MEYHHHLTPHPHCLFLAQVTDRTPCHQTCPEFRPLSQPQGSLSLAGFSDRGCPRPQCAILIFPDKYIQVRSQVLQPHAAVPHCDTPAAIQRGRLRNSIFPDKPALGSDKTSCFIILSGTEGQLCGVSNGRQW